VEFVNLIKSAQAGLLDTQQIKTLRAVEAITADEAESLNDIRKDVARDARDEKKDVDYEDLRGVVNRAGLGGLVTKAPTGQIVVAHGGHVAAFPKGNAARLADLFRATLAFWATQEQGQDSDEEPASLTAVG